MAIKVINKKELITLTLFELIFTLSAYISYTNNKNTIFFISIAFMLLCFLMWLSLVIVRTLYKNINYFVFCLPCYGNFNIPVEWLHVRNFVPLTDAIGIDFYNDSEEKYLKKLNENQIQTHKQSKHQYGYGLILTGIENLEKLQSMKEQAIKDIQIDLANCIREVEIDPTFDNYLAMAGLKMDLHEYNSALEDLNFAYNLGPDKEDLIRVLSMRAYIKEYSEDLQGAVNDYEKMIELESDSCELYEYKAQVELKMQNPEGAIKDLEKAAECTTNNKQRDAIYKKIADISALG